MSYELDSEIDDEEYDDVCEFDEYLNSLSDSERAGEQAWVNAIALAITQGKNVVSNPAILYDFRM
jgi:hypothetical protein